MVYNLHCDICGAKLVVGGGPGEWCKGNPEYHKPMKMHGLYDPFTPYVDPHLLPYSDPRAHETEFNKNLGRHVRGVRITSREQRRKLMKENGIDFAPRPYGSGGTEF